MYLLLSCKYNIYVKTNSNTDDIVLAKIKYVQTMLKLLELNKYKNVNVNKTCKNKVKILLIDVLETCLTPVKYPEREASTELKGILIAII